MKIKLTEKQKVQRTVQIKCAKAKHLEMGRFTYKFNRDRQ